MMVALYAGHAFAQGTQPGCYPYPRTITVTGSAEMNLVPNEIYVLITLREYKKKGENKTELEKIKNDFLSNCRSVGIPDSNISVNSYEGYNLPSIFRRKKKDPDLLASITYQVKFSNTKKIDELVDKLDDEATETFQVARVSHSNISDYRKQLKIMAVKAAKDKAVYLSESVNEKIGEAITIVEPEEYAASDARIRNLSSQAIYSNTSPKDGYKNDNDGVDYRSIRLRFEVKVLFALK